MGIVQGSSGFPFLSPPVFEYVCRVNIPVNILQEHVPNLEVKTFMNKVTVMLILYIIIVV